MMKRMSETQAFILDFGRGENRFKAIDIANSLGARRLGPYVISLESLLDRGLLKNMTGESVHLAEFSLTEEGRAVSEMKTTKAKASKKRSSHRSNKKTGCHIKNDETAAKNLKKRQTIDANQKQGFVAHWSIQRGDRNNQKKIPPLVGIFRSIADFLEAS